MHILCGLLSCDSSPICKKRCCVFAHHYTLDDGLECPMDFELSLPLDIFSYMLSNLVK